MFCDLEAERVLKFSRPFASGCQSLRTRRKRTIQIPACTGKANVHTNALHSLHGVRDDIRKFSVELLHDLVCIVLTEAIETLIPEGRLSNDTSIELRWPPGTPLAEHFPSRASRKDNNAPDSDPWRCRIVQPGANYTS